MRCFAERVQDENCRPIWMLKLDRSGVCLLRYALNKTEAEGAGYLFREEQRRGNLRTQYNPYRDPWS